MADDEVYGSPEHQQFRALVRKFVQAELVPRAREFDESGGPTRRSSGGSARWACSASATTRSTAARASTTRTTRCSSRSWRSATTPASRWESPCRPTWRRRRSHRFGSEELKQRYLVPGDPRRTGGGDRGHRAGRGLRRRGHQHARRPRRRPLGDQRLEDVHHEHRERGLAVPARRHRPRRRATRATRRSSCRPTPRASATACSTRSATAAPIRDCSSSTTSACPSRTRSAMRTAASSSR